MDVSLAIVRLSHRGTLTITEDGCSARASITMKLTKHDGSVFETTHRWAYTGDGEAVSNPVLMCLADLLERTM